MQPLSYKERTFTGGKDMKNKVLRTVYGVMLSAILVITAAFPALAACGPTHNLINATITRAYPNASENSHQVRETTSGTCTDCHEYITLVNTYSEPHTPDSNGKCTACRYQVWHRP